MKNCSAANLGGSRGPRGIIGPLIAVLFLGGASVSSDGLADAHPVAFFWGLHLGEPSHEVESKKGRSATQVISGACRGAPNNSAPFTEQWAYQDDGGVYYVHLRNRKVWSVVFYANRGIAPAFPIGALGDSQSTLESKLGPPSLISTAKDGSAKWAVFEKLHVAYQLRNDRVVMFGVFDPAQGVVQYCD